MTQSIGQQRIPLHRLELQHPMSLGAYDEYEQAQRAVDYLSDREFPVQNVMIVGTDLKQVERVTGRLTSGRVTASGAASGAWMGLFFGGLMWLFVPGMGVAMLLSAMLAGAVFGLVWAFTIYRMAGGARDFTSVTQVVATRYEVLVEHHLADDGRRLLEDMRRGVPAEAGRGHGHGGDAPQPGATAHTEWAPPTGPSHGRPAGSGQADPPPAASHDWGGPDLVSSPKKPQDPTAPTEAAPTKYRTYGEALDAERAAREGNAAAGDAPASAPGPHVAAEDAHDTTPGPAPSPDR